MHAIALAMLLVLTLAGCANNPLMSPAPFKPATDTTGSESDTRARARVHTELAAAYYELGNMGVALEEANAAVGADSSYGPAFNVLGLVYADLREDRLAQQNFERALRMDPLDSDANNNYGRFLCDRQRETEAIKYFMAALRNPLYDSPDRSYVNAGLCSRRRGNIAQAEEYFQKAVALRPNQPQALYQLADLAYTRGSYAQAKEYLARLSKVTVVNAETLWLGVRIERRLGDRDAAASYGVQLARNFPDSKEAQALKAGREE